MQHLLKCMTLGTNTCTRAPFLLSVLLPLLCSTSSASTAATAAAAARTAARYCCIQPRLPRQRQLTAAVALAAAANYTAKQLWLSVKTGGGSKLLKSVYRSH
jgi:hypothetical protein